MKTPSQEDGVEMRSGVAGGVDAGLETGVKSPTDASGWLERASKRFAASLET